MIVDLDRDLENSRGWITVGELVDMVEDVRQGGSVPIAIIRYGPPEVFFVAPAAETGQVEVIRALRKRAGAMFGMSWLDVEWEASDDGTVTLKGRGRKVTAKIP